MDRRKFLDLGVLAALGSLGRSGVFGAAVAGMSFSAARTLLERDPLFQQLLTFQPFREIDRILTTSNRPYMLKGSQTGSDLHASWPMAISVQELNLASINLSYGRFSNFRSSLIDPRSAYVITQGEAGRRLQSKTDMKIISRYSPALSSRSYFADAFPHHFNSFAIGGPKWFREYWMDSSSRAPINLRLQYAAGLPDRLQNEITEHGVGLRDCLASVESQALARIQQRYVLRNFDELISKSPKQVPLTRA